MNFSNCLDMLKMGHRMTRRGWNGRGMFVVLQKGYPQGIPCNKQTAEAWEVYVFDETGEAQKLLLFLYFLSQSKKYVEPN